MLLGLKLLESTPQQKRIPVNDENQTPRDAAIKAYQPHSTVRAKKRADYDTLRDQNMQRKSKQEQREREIEIRRMHKDLDSMRHELV